MPSLRNFIKYRAKQAAPYLPAPIRRRYTRLQHLRHVDRNLIHLTNPAYLGRPEAVDVTWISPHGLPELPSAGIELNPLTEDDADVIRAWLGAGPYDQDDLLDRRTDNHGDELGRVIAALRLRLLLRDGSQGGRPEQHSAASGGRVLFDARSLQTSAFGSRGIGRFARSALLATRAAAGDDQIDLLVDRALERLPDELAGRCGQVRWIHPGQEQAYDLFIQPSPMTASAEPHASVLHGAARKVAIVFDFIPAHYPSVYLRHAAQRVEYAASLDALRWYDSFIGISHLAERELRSYLAAAPKASTVAWPNEVLPPGGFDPAPGSGVGPIVVMTGDEPRKNTFGALAAIGVATAGAEERDVVVLGLAGQDVAVHHASIHAAMRPGEARNAAHLSDTDMQASFDEGLSLPVIEALRVGGTVVGSDIPAHRELIGTGAYLAPPGDLDALARAIRKASTRPRSRRRLRQRAWAALQSHQHETIEEVIAREVDRHHRPRVIPPVSTTVPAERLSIGIATPWLPQRSGVADFSYTTCLELARRCDLTVYTTSGASVEGDIASRHIDEVIVHGSSHDAFITVLGNSHLHIPHIDLMRKVDAIAVLHDTRMVEFYMAMRSPNGAAQVMLRNTGRKELDFPFDEQIDDMRLLQNAGFWEIAQQAAALVTHSPSAAPRIEAETGIRPFVLPFATQRFPWTDEVTDQMRREARQRLGFADGVTHVTTFGFADIRTKMMDLVVESASWLTQWGSPIHLHIAGAAQPDVAAALRARAEEGGLAGFEITGYLQDDTFRDYLLATDVGVQLRVSPLLGVSGPLSDLAAFGTTAVASTGLCIDVDTPAYVHRLPDAVSPVMVAEAVEHALAHPMSYQERERERRAYLERKSPGRYAELLLDVCRQTLEAG
jgi:glycosyltransferase involved in cell wall biosynthesis